jgi:hypothetical protein
MSQPFIVPRGFKMWAKENLNGDRNLLANYLLQCAKEGPQDSIVWNILEETGDKTYDFSTFLKCADIVLRDGGES